MFLCYVPVCVYMYLYMYLQLQSSFTAQNTNIGFVEVIIVQGVKQILMVCKLYVFSSVRNDLIVKLYHTPCVH